ncbi:MAG: hypothetical protein ACW99E_16010 [Promethearchaeota archaeon]
MGFMWLGPIVDFFTIVFTSKNLDNSYGLYSILSYMWVPIPLIFAIYISTQLLIPKIKWYFVSLYMVAAIIFEYFIFFNPMDSFIFDYPENPGWSLIDSRFNTTSPAFIFIVVFVFSVLFNGISFLRKSILSQGIIRKKNLYLALGFFIFFIFSALDLFITPGMFLYVVRIGINLCIVFFYFGLKGESTEPKKSLPKKQVKIKDALFFFTEKKSQPTEGMRNEDPVVLLILTTGGVLIFSYPFTKEWKRDNELLGSFLSAFTSFSDEFLSEGFDRAKFGKYTVLLESVKDFSVCYLFEGQAFYASKRLETFSKQIQNMPSILGALEKCSKTSQALILRDIPSLESLIIENFIENAK